MIYLFSVMGFTVIRCELSLCVHCCCLIAIVGLAATCSTVSEVLVLVLVLVSQVLVLVFVLASLVLK